MFMKPLAKAFSKNGKLSFFSSIKAEEESAAFLGVRKRNSNKRCFGDEISAEFCIFNA